MPPRPTYFLDTSPARIRHWEKYPIAKYPRLAAFVAENYERIAVIDEVVIYRWKGCSGK